MSQAEHTIQKIKTQLDRMESRTKMEAVDEFIEQLEERWLGDAKLDLKAWERLLEEATRYKKKTDRSK